MDIRSLYDARLDITGGQEPQPCLLPFIVVPAHPSLPALLTLFLIAGLALSAEEVLEGTVAAELLPDTLRGTGYGVLAAVNGVGDLVASTTVGLLWATVSPAVGFSFAACTSLLGAVALLRVR